MRVLDFLCLWTGRLVLAGLLAGLAFDAFQIGAATARDLRKIIAKARGEGYFWRDLPSLPRAGWIVLRAQAKARWRGYGVRLG